MLSSSIEDLLDSIEDKIMFLMTKHNQAVREMDAKRTQEASRVITGLMLRREDLLKELTMNEKTIEDHIENDKLNLEIAVREGSDQAKIGHLTDELQHLERYHAEHPEDHHDPSAFEMFCDENPDADECRIYDC